MVILQGIFCTLAPISVFHVNISSSSLKSFTIDPFVNLLQATHRKYFILVSSLPLRWLRVTFVLNTSGGARALKWGGGDNLAPKARAIKRGPGACSPGKILKSGIPETQFPGFSG